MNGLEAPLASHFFLLAILCELLRLLNLGKILYQYSFYTWSIMIEKTFS